MQTNRTLTADPNARNRGGNKKWDGSLPGGTNQETPLHFATGAWDENVIEQLLNAGADKTLTNDLGETPLTGRSNSGHQIEPRNSFARPTPHSNTVYA